MLFDAQSNMALRSRAKLALQLGHLEEAYEILLKMPRFKETRDGQLFGNQLCGAFARRAEDHAAGGQHAEAYIDIQRAIELGGARPNLVKLMKDIQGRLNGSPDAENRPAARTAADRGVRSQRFMLWIDGVGTYMVLPADRITLGRTGSSKTPDVPLAGTLSGLAAEIVRAGEQYILKAHDDTCVNGKPVREKVLTGGDVIRVGDSNILHFYAPCPMNATAVLQVDPPAMLPGDAREVILLEQFLVAGKKGFSHIKTTAGPAQLILFLRDSRLWAKIQVHGGQGSRANKAGDVYPLTMGERTVIHDLGITVTEG